MCYFWIALLKIFAVLSELSRIGWKIGKGTRKVAYWLMIACDRCSCTRSVFLWIIWEETVRPFLLPQPLANAGPCPRVNLAVNREATRQQGGNTKIDIWLSTRHLPPNVPFLPKVQKSFSLLITWWSLTVFRIILLGWYKLSPSVRRQILTNSLLFLLKMRSA